jgi:hypothetical protein
MVMNTNVNSHEAGQRFRRAPGLGSGIVVTSSGARQIEPMQLKKRFAVACKKEFLACYFGPYPKPNFCVSTGASRAHR